MKSKRIDAILEGWLTTPNKNVDLMKIDTEGSEMAVLQSTLPYFKEQRIGIVILEIAPARSVHISSIELIDEVVNTLYDSGYAMRAEGNDLDMTREDCLDLFHNEERPNRSLPINFYIHIAGQELPE